MPTFSKLANKLIRASAVGRRLRRLDSELDELKVLHARSLQLQMKQLDSQRLQDYEFKVFSQWGEDGIIQKLVSSFEFPNKTFIEFGVEDFSEANCRFLMTNNLWRGFVLDGSTANIDRIRAAPYFWRYDLRARAAFITRENINELLRESGFEPDIGLLSIDVDGVDYWILEAITAVQPRLLVLEYNAVFGGERAISVPYKPTFFRTREHHSNLYFGASLAAMAHLAETKGYSLVGTNSAACNAFFVRNDLMKHSPFPALGAREAFVDSVARESRDEAGRLTYVSGRRRYEIIKGMPVVNVLTGEKEDL